MVCHLLDKHKMDINQNNDDLRYFYHDSQDTGSPLCSAMRHENLAVVHELLNRGAKVNSADWNPVRYAVRAGGFFPALEPLLLAGADASISLEISVSHRNLDAAKACLRFGADPALALCEAVELEEYRAYRVAENPAYFESRPESSYRKSEQEVEKARAEERESQAIVALLERAIESLHTVPDVAASH
jgi:ankyrin repeat protein